MIGTRTRRGLAAVAAAAGVVALLPGAAAADPSTGRTRTMDCGGTTYTMELGPAEFLTSVGAAIHAVGSTAVLVPLQVVLTIDGEPVTTLVKPAVQHVPGLTVCSYVDPRGFPVEITGLLSPA